MTVLALSRRTTFVCITLGALCYGLSIGMNFVLFPLLFAAHGLSKTVIGSFVGIEMLGSISISLFLPRLTLRFGLQKIIIATFLVRNLVPVFLPLHAGVNYWAPLLYMSGVSGFALFSSLQFWVNGVAHEDHRGKSIAVLGVSLGLGIALGPWLLRFTGTTGVSPFVISSAICMLAAFPFWYARRSIPRYSSPPEVKMWHVIKTCPLPILGGMVADGVFFSLSSFLTLYGIRLGMPEINAATFLSALMVGSILFEVPIGWLSDHVSRKRLMHVAVAVILVCSQLFLFAGTHIFLLWGVLILWSMAQSALYIPSLALLAERFTGANLLMANSTFVMMNCIGGMISVLLSGRAMDIWNPHGLMYAIACICAVYAIIAFITERRS